MERRREYDIAPRLWVPRVVHDKQSLSVDNKMGFPSVCSDSESGLLLCFLAGGSLVGRGQHLDLVVLILSTDGLWVMR
jgi:hypothetical protein